MKLFWWFLKFVLTIALGAAAIAGSVALFAPASKSLANTTTPLGDLDKTINAPAARTIVYDRFGNVMGSFARQDRSPVKLKDIPQVLIDAVISIEDRKFYEHVGVDLAGSTRALFKNVDVGGISQGGSTITQQLVKNALSTNRKRDLKTKVKEAVLAIRLEHEMSKNQILEDYLNLVYFGNGAYGVQTAAERYFNKPLKQLTLPEAALIAGLIQAPEALNPVRHPDSAARRRNEVLDAMVENHKISVGAARFAKATPLPTKLYYPLSRPLDYYLDEVKNRLLIDDPNVPDEPSEALGATQQARAGMLYRGGLKIYTAFDPTLQITANNAIAETLPSPKVLTASLVVIDNSDGEVRAIANGRSFAESQFDPATEGPGRQPGSSFKVFTLAAALSRGYSPNDSVSTVPLNWRLGPGSGRDSFYHLSGDCSDGSRTLYSAIAASDNCAFVRTELSMGPGHYGQDGVKAVIDTANAMGIDTSKFQPFITTTLGTQGVHPLEMAQAYSVLPNDGVLKRASFITKITRGNKVLYQNSSIGERVLDSNVARTEIDMMKGVLQSGTARGQLSSFGRPAAGKTGTTDGPVDAWFVGFTPQYTAAVWMGDPSGENAMAGISATAVQGGTYPALMWGRFMKAATANLPPIDFLQPDKSLWPRQSSISEYGRRVGYYNPGSSSRRYSSNNNANNNVATTVPAAPVTQPQQEQTTPATSPPPKKQPPGPPKKPPKNQQNG